MLRGCFFNPYLLSPTALILYHISGRKSIGKIHKLSAPNLCNLHRSHKSCRGGRSRHDEKNTPCGEAQEEAVRKGLVICNLKARVRVELTRVVPLPAGTLLPSPSRNRSPYQKGGYTLLTKRSRQCPLWLGLMVMVYGEPCSAPILDTNPRSGVG